MRNAYEHDNHGLLPSSPQSSYDSAYRSGSDDSVSAQPAFHPAGTTSRRPPPIVHNKQPSARNEFVPPQYISDAERCATPTTIDEKRSTDSTVSFVDSEGDPEEYIPQYDPPEYVENLREPSAIPSRPSDFSELFPSHRRLDIRHDDSTEDGNMNLRIDTEVKIHGRKCNMTLFHLRLHDLRRREFSLRRYCRDSGREVCHASRTHKNAAPERRPGIQRSLSNALHSLRPKLEHRTSSGPAAIALERHDSGYSSMHSSDEEYRPTSSGSDGRAQEQLLTNCIKLDFSNYAKVAVNLSKDKKRYEFDYWKYEFAWKRVVDKTTNEKSFHLIDSRQNNKKVLAYIRQIPLTEFEAQEERFNGGWIPQCMMWIADEGIVDASKDVADAVVAAGLMALVDDSIRARFESDESKVLLIPNLQMGMEQVAPARLINEMFSRKEGKVDSSHRHTVSAGQSRTRRATSGSSRPSSRDH